MARLQMLPGWQSVRNDSNIPQRLDDRLLPSGHIVLQPGETTTIPRDSWRRNMRRHQMWMTNADVVPAPPSAEPEIPAEVSVEEETPEASDKTATVPRRRGRRKKSNA